jgi:NADH-quinone oxidoreductase subunit M
MFNGIFGSQTKYNVWFTVLAGLGIILGAVYTLNMIRKVFYGNTNELTAVTKDISLNEKLALVIIIVIIFWLGIYPQVMLNETAASAESIYKKFEMLLQSMKK